MKNLAKHASLRGRAAALAALVAIITGCSSGHNADALKQAKEQIAAGHLDTAMIVLKQHLSEQANSAEGRYVLGSLLLRLRDPRAAEVELGKAKELGFAPDLVVPALAEALQGQGKSAKVLSDLADVKLSDPSAAAALLSLVAEAHMHLGHREQATEAAGKVLATSPDSPRAVMVQARLLAADGNMPAAIARLDALIAKADGNADVWQTKGEFLQHGLNDLDGAVAAYEKSIKLRKDQVGALTALVRLQIARSNIPAAKAAFENLQAQAPNGLQTRFMDAQLAYLSGDFARSRSIVQGLLQVIPDQVQVLTFSGALSLQSKELVTGETHLGRAVKLAPSSTTARKLLAQTRLLLGRPESALHELQPLLEAGSVDATALSLAAEAHLQQGDFKQADSLYQRARNANPGDISLRTAAALSRLARGESDAAMTDLQAVVRDDPGDMAALALISARMRRGEAAAALPEVDKLIAKNSTKASYYSLRGRVLMALANSGEAGKSFAHATELDPAYFPAVQSLALMDARAHDMKSATARLEAFVKKYPRNSDARMTLVEAMIQERRPKQDVAQALDDLIRGDGAYVPARSKLVQLYLSSNSPKQAVAAAQAAVLANPDRQELLMLLGRSQIAASELQQAQTTFSKLAALAPNQIEPLLSMADVQILLGNVTGANSSLRRALDIAPGSQEVRRRLMALSMASKEPDKAIGYARDLQKRQPKAAAGYLFEADIMAERKDWAGSAAVLKSGLAAGAEPATNMAARLYVALVQAGKPADAEALVAARMKQNPPDRKFLLRTAELLMLRNELPASETFFANALKLQPDDANAENNLAWIMMKQGRKGGLLHSARAVELSKGAPAMLDTHALVLASEGQLAKAVEVAGQAVSKAPDNHVFRMNFARLLVQAKQWDKAKEQIDRLRDIKEPFEGAKDLPELSKAVERKA